MLQYSVVFCKFFLLKININSFLKRAVYRPHAYRMKLEDICLLKHQIIHIFSLFKNIFGYLVHISAVLHVSGSVGFSRRIFQNSLYELQNKQMKHTYLLEDPFKSLFYDISFQFEIFCLNRRSYQE